MIWQDVVIAVLQLVFVGSLAPMLCGRTKPPLTTSIPTGLALLAGGATVATLGLWLAAGAQAAIGAGWLWLAWQRWRVHPLTPCHDHAWVNREDGDVGDH